MMTPPQVICKDRVYVLSVPDGIGSSHGKFPTHESNFVHDLVHRIIHHAPSWSHACVC